MKGLLDRTKVVLRHLPPTISKAMLTDQIDPKFSGRYNWLSFVPGNSSQKRIDYSRAYINFKRAEDVIEFAEFFNGHVFVNQKGAQYKAIVEYAPSQHVPKQWLRKDGGEGTIFKDPEYMEFLEFLGKPVEHLPSAEIQLERREAEQAAAGKEALIITPLMDFVRQKRAASSGSRRLLTNGKSMRRTGRHSSESPGAVSSKRSERRRVTKTMYVMRDTAKAASGKDGSADSLISKREFQECYENAVHSGGSAGDEAPIDETGTADIGKKKILLLKGKARDISHVKLFSTSNLRPNPHRETGGRIVRNVVRLERQAQSSKVEKDRQSQPSNVRLLSKSKNGLSYDNISGNDMQVAEKLERRMRNKERPDRVVWTPLRRSDGSHATDESLSSASQSMRIPPPSSEGSHGEKVDNIFVRSEVKLMGSGRNVHSSMDNGSVTYASRRRLAQGGTDADGIVPEGKSATRGVSSGYNSHEKQVWVQKSSASS